MPQKPRFIFILTTGHSGGTLLNLLLGASSEIFAAGESLRLLSLKNLGHYSEDTREFWQVAAAEMSSRGWPIGEMNSTDFDSATLEFWKAWTSIVSGQADGRIIADKTLSFELIRRLSDGQIVDPFFIHLVRDPRAVDFSFQRKYGPNWRTAVTWQKSHLAIENFTCRRSAMMRVRYEDLCAQPDQQMQRILKAVGAHFNLDLLTEYPNGLSERSLCDTIFDNKIFAGNHMRHETSRTGRRISIDVEYTRYLLARHWVRTSIICFPGLVRYRYPIARKKQPT